MDRILCGEATFPRACLSDVSYHCDYACSCGGAAMSGGDGMDPSTRLSFVWCVWVPAAMSGGDGMDANTHAPFVTCAWVPAALSY
jgi:hypothetical protein